MSAVTGSRTDTNDRGVMKYCSDRARNTLPVFSCRRVISLRNRKAPLPPPPHAAAQLIKTLTFNKTPHYHNGKTQSWRKTLGLVCTLSHPVFLHALSMGFGSGRFPDANHAVCLCEYEYVCAYACVCVCILCGPWQLSPFLSPLHPFADFSVL